MFKSYEDLTKQDLQVLTMFREGFREKPYTCSEGFLTVGFGHKIVKGEDFSNGVSLSKAREIFEDDFEEAYTILNKTVTVNGIPCCLSSIDTAFQCCLVLMAYQLGITGTLKFQKMLRAMVVRDDAKVITEMADSKWAKQTPERFYDCVKLVVDN